VLGHETNLKEIRNAYNTLERKSERKKSLDRPQRRWTQLSRLYLKTETVSSLRKVVF
jgi:hypothetical protein